MTDWIAHFREATKGMVVAHVWRGYGTALFIEFGELTLPVGKRRDGSPMSPTSEIGLMIEAGWRIEAVHTIVCGSNSEEEIWEPSFAELVGRQVVDVAIFGRLPELVISLSAGLHVVSLTTVEGDPAWTLFDRRGPKLLAVGCCGGTISCVE